MALELSRNEDARIEYERAINLTTSRGYQSSVIETSKIELEWSPHFTQEGLIMLMLMADSRASETCNESVSRLLSQDKDTEEAKYRKQLVLKREPFRREVKTVVNGMLLAEVLAPVGLPSPGKVDDHTSVVCPDGHTAVCLARIF